MSGRASTEADVPTKPGGLGLVAVDFQRFFLDPGSPVYLSEWDAGAGAQACDLVDTAVKAGLPVAFTAYGAVEGGTGEAWAFQRPLLAGTSEADLTDWAQSRISRGRVYWKGGFDGSDSGFVEDFGHVANWLLVGVQTHRCVLATALGLSRRGLNPIVVTDACLCRWPADQAAGLRVLAAGHARLCTAAQARVLLEGWIS